MRLSIRAIVILLIVIGAVAGGSVLYANRGHGLPNFRNAEVTEGSIVSVVNSTGTVQPVLSVSVGSFVSGPIEKLYVDFNDVVKEKQLLAKIDPRLYEASVARDKALLATRKAEVDRVKAMLQQAVNDEGRLIELRKENKSFASESEMDKAMFGRMALNAELVVAEANVETAAANLKTSEANLAYTEIRAPVSGMIINRKIDQGQTLAASFQTPELFVVAPDMKTKMHILAAVDEADIGLISSAQHRDLSVRFTVDAYPDDLFEGKIFQIRMSSTTTQNVVTYPVVVAAPNADLKLMPGMTASLSFRVAESPAGLRIPNSALRFYPQREHVRPEDRKLLEGGHTESKEDSDSAAARRTAEEKAESRRNRNRRHVWVVDGDFLRAIEVITGVSDNRWTQLVSGDLTLGQKLITGLKAAE